MANPLKREINIAGRKVPIWAIGAGAIGAIALYIVTVARGGKPPGESLAPQETTGETSQVEQQQASFQKAIEQQQTGVENIASQLTGQYAALQSSARSVSLSWGAREVGSPCEWRGGARHCSRAMGGDSGLETC